MRGVRGLSLIAAVVFAISCGPGASGSANATNSTDAAGGGGRGHLANPCNLLTQGEITAVVGIEFGAAEPYPDGQSCNWRTSKARPEALTNSVVTVEVYEDKPDEMTSLFNPVKASGVGDEADYCGACPLDRKLFVRAGNKYFSVDEYPCYPAGPCGVAMQDERTLALKVLPRL